MERDADVLAAEFPPLRDQEVADSFLGAVLLGARDAEAADVMSSFRHPRWRRMARNWKP